MQVGGAFVNHTTRVVDPVEGGHVGTTAAVVNGWVVGVGNVVGGTVLDVEVATVVEVEVDVVVVVFLAGSVDEEHDADDGKSHDCATDYTPCVAAPLPALFDDGLLLFTSGSLPRSLIGRHGSKGYLTCRAKRIRGPLGQESTPAATRLCGRRVAGRPDPAVGWLA